MNTPVERIDAMLAKCREIKAELSAKLDQDETTLELMDRQDTQSMPKSVHQSEIPDNVVQLFKAGTRE